MLGILVVASACGEPVGPHEAPDAQARSSLPVSRPLVRFRSEPGVRLGEGVQMRWFGLGEEPVRAFVCEHDCSVSIDGGHPPQGDLEARAAVLPGPTHEAVWFAVLREGPGPAGDGSIVWAASLHAGETRTLRVPFPDSRGSALRLVARGPGGPSLRAAWLEPRVVGTRPAPPAAPGAPNIVLVTSDTTRRDAIGCYGGTTATPEIDRLAKEGALFENAHSVAFGTNPSHASLMTSTHAARHGVTDNRAVLGPDLPVLAEVLADGGYATVAFVSAVVLTRAAGLARGFDLYDDSFGLERPGDRTVSLFTRWLREEARPPFFAWIHLYDPHQPYAPPGGRERRYLPAGVDAETVARVDSLVARADTRGRAGFIDPVRIEELAPDALGDVDRVARARYQGEVAFVDEQVGRLRAALAERGLLDRTIFVFAADHGENFLDRGVAVAFDHAGLHHDVTQIPLILRLPGGSFLGRSASLVSNLDVAPTLVGLAGLPAPAEWTGAPLVSTAGELLDPAHGHLVLEGAHRRETAVRTADWLYRALRAPGRDSARVQAVQGYAPGRPAELYSLATDPDERHSVYPRDGDAGGPVLASLEEIVEAFAASAGSGPVAAELDADHIRALEALGYGEAPGAVEGGARDLR